MKTHQLFTKDECNEIIKYVESHYDLTYIEKSLITGYTSYHKILINKTDLIENSSWFYDRISNWVNNELNINASGNIFFVKYKKGDSFPIHIDRVKSSGYHYDFLWNINIILNDEYEGGEFIINDTHYKEPAGTIYYYSSDTPHGVTEITEGERYIMLYHIRERDVRTVRNLL